MEGAGEQNARWGKHVGLASYYHRRIADGLEPGQLARVREAELHAGCDSWSVVKLRRDQPYRVSLLTYQDFSAAFPALLQSLTVDLEKGSVSARCYRTRANPPILHRKELLVGAEHPDFERYLRLTRALEALGLLGDATRIGTRAAWEARLAQAGVRVVDHDLVQVEACEAPLIHRHRAAIRRDGLSAPVQALLAHGLVKAGTTVFDYGCGRGSDIRGLVALGVKAAGWDPYFAPETPRIKAEVVNLGFVLNVIERPLERVEALRAAFALAGKCLAVAVIQPNAARWVTGRPFCDGVVTRLGTFQKFFTASEIKALVQQTLGREAFAVAPGVFLVFKDACAEQELLLRRQERRPPAWSTARESERLAARRRALAEEIDRIAELALDLGRPPFADELDEPVLERIKAVGAGYASVVRLALSQVGETRMALAREARREDLAVYFALNLFNRRLAYRTLPLRLQRDIKTLFGDHRTAVEHGRRLLFSLAHVDGLRAATEGAAEAGDGVMAEEAFWVLSDSVPRLPAVLRCFIGCAERYIGGLEDAQVFKVHLQTGKLTALSFSGFERSPLPRLTTRAKIDLRRQRIDVFDHGDEDQRLVGKSRLLPRDDPGLAKQRAFDAALVETGLDVSQFRALGPQIQTVLSDAGFIRDGWRIIPAPDRRAPL
jgi:DNA phosphorothioation-associated putative methyltransferase